MRRLIFILYIFAMIAIALIVGCSGQPLDLVLQNSDRHSSEIVSEITECYKGLVVDAENDSYFVQFSKVCVDGVITGTEASMPTLPPGVTATDIQTIVSDVATGGTDYEGAWVYVEGTVKSDLTDGGRSITLETNNESVIFRVSSFVKVSQLSRWVKGNRYGFILFISNIQTSETTGKTTIFSRVDDPDNFRKAKSLLTPTTRDVIPTSIPVILESLRRGESYYLGKRVSFIDTVKVRNEDRTSESLGTTYDSLVVYHGKATLFATSRDSFTIYPTMELFQGDIDPKYTKGSFHVFEVTIHHLSGEDFFDVDKVRITAYFEDKTFLPE